MRVQTKTVFIGLSHLGLVASIGWASRGRSVIGIDEDKKVIDSLKKGVPLIMEDDTVLREPGLAELFKKTKKNYNPTSDFSEISKAQLVFFSKDTPKDIPNPENIIRELVKKSTPYFNQDVTVVIMSQVPIGFCREIQNYIKKTRPNLSFSLYHFVDTIVMTNALDRFLNPERIILGMDNSKDALPKFFDKELKSFRCPVFKMSFESAELTKAAINLYLANSVTFANTLSDFCEAVGANMNEIIPALRTDARIGPSAYIKPNLRIAGGHLERDLLMLEKLAKKKGISSGTAGFIIQQNNKRYKWALKKIAPILGHSKPTVCIWGLAYKKDSTSTKNAASLELLKSLKGKANLKVYDPLAIVPKNINGYTRFTDKYDAVRGSDCLLIVTEWDEFKKAQPLKLNKLMKSRIIIDAPGIMNPEIKKLSEFNYISMGVGNPHN